VHVLSLYGGAWNFGGSILTFLFPMILFVLVASTLFVLYTAPQAVPGHAPGIPDHPVSYTAVPRVEDATAPAPAEAPPAEAPAAEGGATEGGAPGTGDGA
jgi:hypothetical protein